MLLSTAYLPPVSYFQKMARAGQAQIEAQENFVKQTYRNRCHIYGANGVLALIIPLVNTHEKTLISEKRIAYKQDWQKQHWRSIESAYRNTPYFIYYADQLQPFYENQTEFLLEYNTELLKVILKLLKLQISVGFTETYQKEDREDHRDSISPKATMFKGLKPYTQVFAEKHGFKPDLSIIDLLFNQGPQAASFLYP